MMTWKSLRGLQMAAVTLAIGGLAAPLSAQVPGVPVLQNAFANPGLAFAANFGTGGGQSFFGAAAGWGLGGGRLLLSGAAGVQRANESTRGAYGVRGTFSAWTSAGGALGASAFAGIGGAPRTRNDDITTNAAQLIVPVGLSVGYRRPLGESRGFSVYASPIYRWTRAEANDVSATASGFAASVGVDFALTRSIGLTAGGEFGQREGTGSGSGSLLGFAVSFIPRR